MEHLRDAVINLAQKPLSTDHKNHIDQRLHQLFPVFHTPSHPPYAAMIHRAIVELNEKWGSSEESISRFIKANFDDLPWGHATLLSHHLGKLTAKGEIFTFSKRYYMRPVENNPIPVKQRRKQKRGQERCGRQDRCGSENIVGEEEKSQSHEQDSENDERIQRGEGGEIEVFEDQNQSIEGIGKELVAIEVYVGHSQPVGQQCELIEQQNWPRGAQNHVEEQRIEVDEEEDQLQEQQSEESKEQKIELIEEQNQGKQVQGDVIGEENEPHEQQSEARTEIFASCCELGGYALMVPSSESKRNEYLEEEKEEEEQQRQTDNPCGQRVVEEQIQRQEQAHGVIEQQFQPHEQEVGDALMVFSGVSHRCVVEEDKNECLVEEKDEEQQTGNLCGERKFSVEEQMQSQEQELVVIKEQCRPNEEDVEVRCDGDGDNLIVRFGESQMLVVKQEKNQSLEEEQQQNQIESPLERREFVVEVIKQQNDALEQENEVTQELKQPEKQQNEVIDEQFQPQEEQIEVKTQILLSCHDVDCDGNDLGVHPGVACKPITKGKNKRSLVEEKQKKTKITFEGKEIVTICASPAQQKEQQSKSDWKGSTMEETSLTIENQAKRRSRRKRSTSQPTTMRTLDLPLTPSQRKPEQQQEFPNQERPLKVKRKRVEGFSETQKGQRQQTQHELLQRVLRSHSRGPPKPEPAIATTIPSQLEQQQRSRRGRPLKKKPDVDAIMGDIMTSQNKQMKRKRGRLGRPPKPKPIVDTLTSQNQQKKPKRARRGRPPKPKPEADTIIGDSLTSLNQQQKPKRKRGRPPQPKLDADTTIADLLTSQKLQQ